MHFFPHAITSTPDRLFVASFDLPWSTPPVYCDGCPKRDSVALERIQLAVARAVLRCSRRDVSNTQTLRRIGWPTMEGRRRRQKLSVLWDLLQQRGPPKLCDKVSRTAAQRCDYSLRNSSSPAIPL